MHGFHPENDTVLHIKCWTYCEVNLTSSHDVVQERVNSVKLRNTRGQRFNRTGRAGERAGLLNLWLYLKCVRKPIFIKATVFCRKVTSVASVPVYNGSSDQDKYYFYFNGRVPNAHIKKKSKYLPVTWPTGWSFIELAGQFFREMEWQKHADSDGVFFSTALRSNSAVNLLRIVSSYLEVIENDHARILVVPLFEFVFWI